MTCFMFILLAISGASVPHVTAGPTLTEQARALQASIDEVVVYSDRARIRRRAQLDLTHGVHTLLLPDLPGATLIDTIRVACLQARILRVEATMLERERFSIKQVEDLIRQLENLTDALAMLDKESSLAQAELSFLQAILPKPAVDESKRVGKKDPPVVVEGWRRVLDFLDQRKQDGRRRIRKLAFTRKELEKKVDQVQREIQRHDLGAFSSRKIQVLVMMQAEKAVRAVFDLEYFVPGASWMPSYEVYFDPDRRRSSIRSFGMVRQATGEDWKDVRLALSTAIPGQGINLPELHTWALGEKKEFVPKARPVRMPDKLIYKPLPKAKLTDWEAELAIMRDVLQEQLATLQAIATDESSRHYVSSTAARVKAKTIRKKRAKKHMRSSLDRRGPHPSSPTGAMSSIPAKVVVPKEEKIEEIVLTGSRMRSAQHTVETPLDIFEPDAYTPPRFSDPNLPAVTAGGFDYLYTCKTLTSLPSTGKSHRVPLGVDDFPMETRYEATPSLMTTAFLKALVTNRGKQPILQGSAGIFVKNTYVGQGKLKTTGKGGVIELPLGADEDIRILRRVIPKTVTEGVFSKHDLTTYTTIIEIANHKKNPIRIRVFDQIPKTRKEEIEIRLEKVTPKPVSKPDADGILTWDLDIPVGKTQKIQFRYQIERPIDWQLTQ